MQVLSKIKRFIVKEANRRELKKVNYVLSKKVFVNGRVKVYGQGSIVIGEGTRINSGEKYNPIGGENRTIFSLRSNGEIIIGRDVGISNSTLVARKRIIIDDYVLIGGGCKIYDNDFHSIDFEQRFEKPDIHVVHAPVHICSGAFIGAHCIVLKGVTIGERAVIGAGSVVTKDVPPDEIWAGNPARFIRKINQGGQDI